MPENQFDDLLREWQEARAAHDFGVIGGGFTLHVIPSEQASGYHSSPACDYVGSIFLRDAANTCYQVFGNFRSHGWDEGRHALDLFMQLAQRTGSRLPSAFCKRFSGRQNNPTSDWLACMWHYNPPPAAQCDQPPQWWSPFQAAIETLEKAGLVGGSQTGGNGESATPPLDIAKLERETPPLDRGNGQWVKNKLAADLEGVKTRTLADYRVKGQTTADEMFGVDKDGRIWRRAGTRRSHQWYLRSSLQAEQSKPKNRR